MVAPDSFLALSGRAARNVQTELAAVALETAGAVPKPHDRPFADRARAARVLRHQRPQDFAVPGFGS